MVMFGKLVFESEQNYRGPCMIGQWQTLAKMCPVRLYIGRQVILHLHDVFSYMYCFICSMPFWYEFVGSLVIYLSLKECTDNLFGHVTFYICGVWGTAAVCVCDLVFLL